MEPWRVGFTWKGVPALNLAGPRARDKVLAQLMPPRAAFRLRVRSVCRKLADPMRTHIMHMTKARNSPSTPIGESYRTWRVYRPGSWRAKAAAQLPCAREARIREHRDYDQHAEVRTGIRSRTLAMPFLPHRAFATSSRGQTAKVGFVQTKKYQSSLGVRGARVVICPALKGVGVTLGSPQHTQVSTHLGQ
jgi:hypothetical protein